MRQIGVKTSFEARITVARPERQGLDYFPKEVDFYRNRKIRAIRKEHGLIADAIIDRLLCAIYENGYYLKWDALGREAFLEDTGCDPEVLDAVVQRAVDFELFDAESFEKYIITSKAIQEQFVLSTRRRKVDYSTLEHWLGLHDVDNNPPSAELLLTSCQQKPHFGTQSKVKESKVEESKVEESKVKLGRVRVDDLGYYFPKGIREHFADEFNSNSCYTGTGRIPMAKYETIWLTPTELEKIAETYELAEFPGDRWSIAFGLVDAQNKKNLNSGKSLTFIDSYTALMGWALQRALEQTASSLRVSREAEFLGRARS